MSWGLTWPGAVLFTTTHELEVIPPREKVGRKEEQPGSVRRSIKNIFTRSGGLGWIIVMVRELGKNSFFKEY